MMRIITTFLVVLFILTGCNQSEGVPSEQSAATHNPTADEILAKNPNADIFQLDGIIYSNANNVEWVQQSELTIGEKVGTITKKYKDGLTFEDKMATKLPVGAEIFEPVKKSGPILIVRLNDNEIRYLGLIEG